jgi:hypothetical protein
MGAFSKNIAEMWLVLSATIIWTLAGRGSCVSEEGIKTDLPTLYSISSQHIRHQYKSSLRSRCKGLAVVRTCLLCLCAIFSIWTVKDLEKQRVCMKLCLKLAKNLHWDFSEVEASLWIGLFKPYTMLRKLPTFQIGQNVHRGRSQNWTAFDLNGRWSCWESAWVLWFV